MPTETRVLVTGHDSLRYYLHDYAIAYAGSLLPSFEDNAEPSAAEIDALVAAKRGQGMADQGLGGQRQILLGRLPTETGAAAGGRNEGEVTWRMA